MRKVRVAVIGVGNMGSAHAKHIADGGVTGMELVAVCDPDQAKLDWSRQRLGDIAFYKDYHQLLDDKICDAIVIATPHYLHPVIAAEAFEKGYHVLSEKPAGVYTKQVREMNEAAANVCVQISVWTNTISSFGLIPRSAITGAYGEISVRNHQSIFQSGCPILHFARLFLNALFLLPMSLDCPCS